MTLPLAGVLILDLADEPLALAGRLLADLGADVVRVEDAAGDALRRRGPWVGGEPGVERGLAHLLYNAGKRSVALNLAHSAAPSILDQLAAKTLLITHDSDAPKSKRRCFVGIDNYDAGRLDAATYEQAQVLKKANDERLAAEMEAVVGFAGLGVTLSALRGGRRLALANKESLIAAGPVVQPLRAVHGAELVPVDSEHCAIHQCLRSAGDDRAVAQLVLTASGGPFRGRTEADLAGVTVAEALAHPTWSMGPKITVDSSTLVNKGLEVIEAHELFGTPYDDIDVVVHPTSVVHSMATFTDGTTMAQLSLPDMRLPISYALHYPGRGRVAFGRLDVSQPFDLRFEPPDRAAFRCLDLAYAAGRAGATAPAWFSAANEVAVDAFLQGRIRWVDIAAVNDAALQRWDGTAAADVEAVLAADSAARRVAAELISIQEAA